MPSPPPAGLQLTAERGVHGLPAGATPAACGDSHPRGCGHIAFQVPTGSPLLSHAGGSGGKTHLPGLQDTVWPWGREGGGAAPWGTSVTWVAPLFLPAPQLLPAAGFLSTASEKTLGGRWPGAFLTDMSGSGLL